MKIRTDFVTNSSSSSFIIAKTKECTLEEIENILRTMKDDIIETLAETTRIEPSQEYIDAFIQHLASKLFNLSYNVQLDSWQATSEMYDSDSDVEDYFMYGHGSKMKSEHFKVGWCG